MVRHSPRATNSELRCLWASFLKCARALAGFREMPKFCLVLLLASTRRSLVSIGTAIEPSWMFEREQLFITLAERPRWLARGSAPDGSTRRASYDRSACASIGRSLLLPMAQNTTVASRLEEFLKVRSPGPPPEGARLGLVYPRSNRSLDWSGEVLVAPSTDPGWNAATLTALVWSWRSAHMRTVLVSPRVWIPQLLGCRRDGACRHGSAGTVDGSAGFTVYVVEEGVAVTR